MSRDIINTQDPHDLLNDCDAMPTNSSHSPLPSPRPHSAELKTIGTSTMDGTFARQSLQSIAPFLTKHIPDQYAPLGVQPNLPRGRTDSSNTKYCYRHHPDLKCRRQANEPSMEQLQQELGALPQADQEGISHVWSLFSAAPSKHRDLMLQGILAQCCFPQLSAISAAVKDLIKIDFLAALPAEIGLRILSFLDPTSICMAAQVSARWRTLADDDVVWHRMCKQHIDRKCFKCGIGLPLLDQQRLRIAERRIRLRESGQHNLDGPNGHPHQVSAQPSLPATPGTPNIPPPPAVAGVKRSATEPVQASGSATKRLCGPSESSEVTTKDYFPPRQQPWKDVYRERYRIGRNWKYGRCSQKVFKGHTNGVMCLQFDDHILASGSYDSTIKIWDIEKGTEIRTLLGHRLGVRCLHFDGSRLASGSLDGTVKVWDLNTGAQLCSLSGHTGGVVGLWFQGTLVASGSTDSTVRVWNFKDKSSVTLRGHRDWVNCVRVDMRSRTLLSASDDCTVRLWDLDSRRCIRVYEGHVGPVQQVVPLPPEFELSDDNVAPEDAPETAAPFRFTSPGGDDEANADRPLPPRYMLTGGLDCNIRLWDVHTGACLRTFFGHLEGIWGLAADTLRVVSGANDGMVKLWDPRTGRCERTYAGHAGPVTCVGLSDKRLCTGSEDHEIRLYSFCA